MLELNKIYKCDVLEGLKQLEDNSIDLIITSPPYNKAGLLGKTRYNESKSNWKHSIVYGGNWELDNKPEDEYREWQIEVLNECYRVLKPDGSMFYNHKNRLKDGVSITPYEWILKSKFIVRQEIVWDRGSSLNVNKCRYRPTSERIYWLVKGKPTFSIVGDYKNEIWRFDWDRKNTHPAPFPITLPNIIIPSVAQGRSITILDPFMGSGTVAVSAKLNGCNYLGFELFQEYIDMADNRLKTIEYGR